MSKFSEIIKDQYNLISEQEADMPVDSGELDPMGGEPGSVQPPVQPKQVTTEGKKFLIEIMIKALAFDPDHLSEFDKSIFDEEVTIDNAEEVLKKIEAIVEADIDEHENT
jgi:hypothetical protein